MVYDFMELNLSGDACTCHIIHDYHIIQAEPRNPATSAWSIGIRDPPPEVARPSP